MASRLTESERIRLPDQILANARFIHGYDESVQLLTSRKPSNIPGIEIPDQTVVKATIFLRRTSRDQTRDLSKQCEQADGPTRLDAMEALLKKLELRVTEKLEKYPLDRESNGLPMTPPAPERPSHIAIGATNPPQYLHQQQDVHPQQYHHPQPYQSYQQPQQYVHPEPWPSVQQQPQPQPQQQYPHFGGGSASYQPHQR